MRPPAFWSDPSARLLPALLAPLAALYAAATARRVARPGWRAPVPVVCCGNVGAGGAGKTTLALDLGARLRALGHRPAFITRGYGGRLRGAAQVDPTRHSAADVGDEALLLAACAPTFRAADRAAAARLAIAGGADVLVMDDGLQNPGLIQTVSLLVIDGAAGFGNGHVIPAGPLREPVPCAASRCQAGVLIGADRHGALACLPATLPVLRAELTPGPQLGALIGQRVLAFAGIARPAKFFDMLHAGGAVLVGQRAFADHHPFTDAELTALFAEADHLAAIPVTTPKDAARLPPAARARVTVVDVRLRWQDGAAIDHLLESLPWHP